jgi:cytochrome d ubiquinol oxidase subunit II
MFSAFYLALVVVLVALIVRGVSFEFQRKVDDPRWRAVWRWSLTVGSALIPLLLGTALGDLLHGLPIDSAHNYTGNFFGLLVPFGLFTGVTLTVVCLFLGSTYLTLKTTGELHDRISSLSGRIGWVAAVLVWIFVTWSHLGLGKGFVPNPLDAVAVMAAFAAAWLAEVEQEGWAFTAACLAIASTVGSIFFDLYPHVMVSTTNAAYTLKVMTIVAIVFFPVVLAYQAWNFWVFRSRIRSPRVGGTVSPGPTDDDDRSPSGPAGVAGSPSIQNGASDG